MKRLLTRKELCELLRIEYSTLNRMMNAGEFIASVNGRGRKLLFDPDALERWLQDRQQSVTPTATTSKQRRKDKKAFEQRQADAQSTLDRHSRNRKEGGRND